MVNDSNQVKGSNKLNALMSQQVGFGLTLSGWVSIPVIFGFFLGKYLTEGLNFPNYVFYVCVALSVVFSFYGLIKETMKYAKKLEALQKEEKTAKDSQIRSINNIENSN